MKIVVLVGDGMGDFPVESLGGLTPLQAAKAPTLQKIASSGDLRMVNTVPKNLSPGSDVANMALLGYDAEHSYTGRVLTGTYRCKHKMNPSDVAFRCNLVTIEDNNIMKDYSAGHISSKESDEIIKFLQNELGDEQLNFYSGVQYRHILMTKGMGENTICIPISRNYRQKYFRIFTYWN